MSTGEKANILLVDDRPENLMALEATLSDLGQTLVTAQSGREALKRLLDDDYAVILLDVQMPDMNGFETAALIRAREKTQHTPIVFLTAINKSDVHVTRGYSVGAVDYVFKPFEPEVLKAKVAAFVELSRKTQELKAEVARRKEAEEKVRRLNEDLERRVEERTAALQATNIELQNEIAERKRAEQVLAQNQAHIAALNERLQRAMTETHHRVKNNLQLIAAMLDMRLMENTPSISMHEIKRLGSYIRTLAAVHDILTEQAKSDGQAYMVSAKEILERLLPMLQEACPDRKLAFRIEAATLTARQGTSLALVTNELVSNGLKHGRGTVDVALSIAEDHVLLEVGDDGPGFPTSFDPAHAANTGLELVENLSRYDLGARVLYINRPEGGACVRITFPLPDTSLLSQP
jgi:two-component sensor histidine kinase